MYIHLYILVKSLKKILYFYILIYFKFKKYINNYKSLIYIFIYIYLILNYFQKTNF